MKQVFFFFTLLIFPFQCIKAAGPKKEAKGKAIAAEIEAASLSGKYFVPYNLFTKTTDEKSAGIIKGLTDSFSVMALNKSSLQNLLTAKPEFVKLIIPGYDNKPMEVLLYKHDITSPDFIFTTASGKTYSTDEIGGLHYWGILNNDPGSLAAISVFEDDVMGLIATDYGNLNLGRIQNSKNFVLYNEFGLKEKNPFRCANNEDVPFDEKENSNGHSSGSRTAKCVKLYWEINYDVYQNKGTLSATTNFATGMFNQSQILYANEAISVSLSQLKVWDTPSPYSGSDSYDYLNSFQSNVNTFNGDLAHIITLETSMGGVAATINGLCDNLSDRKCFSGISATFSVVPAYSWSINVITHEQGHLMGSRHTHACAWVVGGQQNQAIDGCGPTYSNDIFYEGSCSGAPIPTNGGTIMSYCHLGAAKVNLNRGFSTQPASKIIQRINEANCLTACTVCVPPVNDDCSAASAIQDAVTCNYSLGNIDCATDDGLADVPTCNGNGTGSAGVFYQFTAATAGVTIQVIPTITTAAGLDPVVVLYTGTNCADMTEMPLGCADNGGNGEPETIEAEVIQGQKYWIRIYHYSTTLPVSGNGRFQICVTHPNPAGCTKPTNVVIPDATGTTSATLTCSAKAGTGNTLAYKWYSGTDCSGTILGTDSTLRVTSEGYYACKVYVEGNEANCSECVYGFAVVTSPSSNILMTGSANYTTCNGIFYDGGGASGNYLNDQNDVVTISPATPGTKISVNFSYFRTQTQYTQFKNTSQILDDVLFVYDGNSTAAPQINALFGQTSPGVITSSAADGSLTFKFVSGKPNSTPATGIRLGWAATINCYSTGINDMNSRNVKIEAYPNPVNEILNISCSGLPAGAYTLTLTNVVGQIADKTEITTTSNDITGSFNTAKLAPGMYFLTLHGTNITKVIKVQKQ